MPPGERLFKSGSGRWRPVMVAVPPHCHATRARRGECFGVPCPPSGQSRDCLAVATVWRLDGRPPHFSRSPLGQQITYADVDGPRRADVDLGSR
jgi:hypothetical protein